MKTPETISVRVRGASKQRILINGEEDKVIFLNLSDTGILDRLSDTYKKLYAEAQTATELKANETSNINADDTQQFLDELKDIDAKLREMIDYIFDSSVADACSAGGKMYDPVDGLYRFEVIVEDLLSLYGETLPAEFEKIQNRREEHTQKYTKKK